MKKLENLTELEQKTMDAYVSMLDAEPGFSNVDVNDLTLVTGVSTKTLRGVLSSLIKKGIIRINDNGAGYQIIDLDTEYWHLVNEEWAADAEFFMNRNKTNTQK